MLLVFAATAAVVVADTICNKSLPSMLFLLLLLILLLSLSSMVTLIVVGCIVGLSLRHDFNLNGFWATLFNTKIQKMPLTNKKRSAKIVVRAQMLFTDIHMYVRTYLFTYNTSVVEMYGRYVACWRTCFCF